MKSPAEGDRARPSFRGIGRRLRELFQSREFAEEFFDELQDAMIEADMGVRTAAETVEALRTEARSRGIRTRSELLAELKSRLGGLVLAREIVLAPGGLNVLLVLGVNGVGKTTTIAKLARHLQRQRGVKNIVLAAGDTFRAAAIEQLQVLGARLELPVVAQEAGADPGAVVFDAISSAAARGAEVLIADTAGRLHNKEALVKELAKIDRIVQSKVDPAHYQRLLVLDATTGQNSLAQAEAFHAAVGVSSIVLTKLDSTAKGGMVIPICRELHIPISYVGLGETLDDLQPFDAGAYLDSLLGTS